MSRKCLKWPQMVHIPKCWIVPCKMLYCKTIVINMIVKLFLKSTAISLTSTLQIWPWTIVLFVKPYTNHRMLSACISRPCVFCRTHLILASAISPPWGVTVIWNSPGIYCRSCPYPNRRLVRVVVVIPAGVPVVGVADTSGQSPGQTDSTSDGWMVGRVVRVGLYRREPARFSNPYRSTLA